MHSDGTGGFISVPDTDNPNKINPHLNFARGGYFANVHKVDQVGFTYYTFILGKEFRGRVQFEDLVLLERREVLNG
jgi:hypothetical protein